MKSNWETAQARSTYHFDPEQKDNPRAVMTALGHITPTWQADLASIVSNAKPATWATRGYKGEGIEAPAEDLAAEEYDLTSHGMSRDLPITHLNWRIPESLQRISDNFGLKDCMARIHVQQPGEVWNLHIDKLQKWAPDAPESVIRIMIQLTDWQPGQFWEYGNYHWNQWSAGDVSTFDWANIPHSTANAGHHPRVTLQLTGIRTKQTDDHLLTLNYKQ
jgi:hypothetical protein